MLYQQPKTREHAVITYAYASTMSYMTVYKVRAMVQLSPNAHSPCHKILSRCSTATLLLKPPATVVA